MLFINETSWVTNSSGLSYPINKSSNASIALISRKFVGSSIIKKLKSDVTSFASFTFALSPSLRTSTFLNTSSSLNPNLAKIILVIV